jgi:hypothetical protein
VSLGVRCVCHGVTYTTVSAYLAAHPYDGEQLELELDDAAARHPSAASRRYVGTFSDGSQVFVEEHVPGKMTAAVRSASWSVWGPPTFLDDAP